MIPRHIYGKSLIPAAIGIGMFLSLATAKSDPVVAGDSDRDASGINTALEDHGRGRVTFRKEGDYLYCQAARAPI
jgi:hypothetical protein